MNNLKQAILINRKDNVATALGAIKMGEEVDIVCNNEIIKKICALEDIEIYHKISINPILEGEKVFKYNEIIGIATRNIKTGQHVHVNNIKSEVIKNEN